VLVLTGKEEKPPRERENVFTRHPKGADILQKILNKTLSQTAAAQLLGCTPQNISIYLKSKKLRATRKDKLPTAGPTALDLAREKLTGLEEVTFTIDGKTPNEMIASIGWKTIQQGLLILSKNEGLEPEQYVKVTNQLMKMWEFQFRHEVPEIPQEELRISKEQEKELKKQVFEDHEKWCPYKQPFIKRKADKQRKARLESSQSSPVG